MIRIMNLSLIMSIFLTLKYLYMCNIHYVWDWKLKYKFKTDNST